MTEIENNPVPLGNRPFIEGGRGEQVKQRVGLRAGVGQARAKDWSRRRQAGGHRTLIYYLCHPLLIPTAGWSRNSGSVVSGRRQSEDRLDSRRRLPARTLKAPPPVRW